jgi:hypothetical protein
MGDECTVTMAPVVSNAGIFVDNKAGKAHSLETCGDIETRLPLVTSVLMSLVRIRKDIPAPTTNTVGSSCANSFSFSLRSSQLPAAVPPTNELFPPCGLRAPAISSWLFSSWSDVEMKCAFHAPSSPCASLRKPLPFPTFVSKWNMDSTHSRPSMGCSSLGANCPDSWSLRFVIPAPMFWERKSVIFDTPRTVRKSHVKVKKSRHQLSV